MIHPDTKLVEINDTIGVGIVATADIPKGTITWCDDELNLVLTARQVKKLPRHIRLSFLKYAPRNDLGHYVLDWDNARYQNHSCDPTSCRVPQFECEIAIRDIRTGEQLCADYGTYGLDKGFACFCGSPNCRSFIDPKDKEMRFLAYESTVSKALLQLDNVPQPLLLPSGKLPPSREVGIADVESLPLWSSITAFVLRQWNSLRNW